jgi:hypothetical protein
VRPADLPQTPDREGRCDRQQRQIADREQREPHDAGLQVHPRNGRGGMVELLLPREGKDKCGEEADEQKRGQKEVRKAAFRARSGTSGTSHKRYCGDSTPEEAMLSNRNRTVRANRAARAASSATVPATSRATVVSGAIFVSRGIIRETVFRAPKLDTVSVGMWNRRPAIIAIHAHVDSTSRPRLP